MDFPDHTQFYWYRSGPLKIPDWPTSRSSLLTPTPPSTPLLEVSPDSAFRPVQPLTSEVIDIPVTHPTPTRGQPQMRTFGRPDIEEPQPFSYTRSFSQEQRMEIDRQVAIRLQEIELAQQHQQEPKPSRPDDRFATVRSSTQTSRV